MSFHEVAIYFRFRGIRIWLELFHFRGMNTGAVSSTAFGEQEFPGEPLKRYYSRNTFSTALRRVDVFAGQATSTAMAR